MGGRAGQWVLPMNQPTVNESSLLFLNETEGMEPTVGKCETCGFPDCIVL